MATRIDDRIHPTLRRARPLAQTELLPSRKQGAGRTGYGRIQVQAVPARTALTDFTFGGNRTGVAWSLNPYVGCAHACTYCYVPSTIKAERRRWGGYVLVKEGLPRLLQQEMRQKRPMTVYLSTGTDAYQPIEQEQRITRRCLERLAAKDWPVEILTRSPLVLRDLDLLTKFGKVRVGMSIPTLDDEARALLEPAAPPVEARLRALQRLADAGLQTFVNYTPAYPMTNDITPRFIAQTFQSVGVQWANTSPFRRLQDILPDLQRAAGHDSDLVPRIHDERRQLGLQQALQRAFDDIGLPLGTGFFNPPFEGPCGTTLGSTAG